MKGKGTTGPKTCQGIVLQNPKRRKDEKFGWLSPFEVYYFPKSNVVTKASPSSRTKALLN